jgi:hypothetical protein
MDMKEFATLLREAAGYAYGKSDGGLLVSIEVSPYGFRVIATKAVADLEHGYHCSERVTFEEVFAAKFPVLNKVVDKAIAAVEASVSDHAA